MNVQVTIKINRESIEEVAEIFSKAIVQILGNRPDTSRRPEKYMEGVVTAEKIMAGTVPESIQPVQELTSRPESPSAAIPPQHPAPTLQASPRQPAQIPVQIPTQRPIPVSQAVPQQTAIPEPQPGPSVQAVPTTAHMYTLDELAGAAMLLMDRGMQRQLQELLARYGVEALPALSPEQYGSFATALREMGAQI